MPTEGSEEATMALSHTVDKAFNGEFKDNYNSIDWLCLPRFMKPPISSRPMPSWIY
jgi:hypothetical protein